MSIKVTLEIRQDVSEVDAEASVQKLRDMGAEVARDGREVVATFETDESWSKFQSVFAEELGLGD